MSLINWAQTARQKEVIEAYEKHGTEEKAALALGVVRSTVADMLQRVRRRAVKQGYSPDHDLTHAVPEGYHLKGTSTLYNSKGEVSQQWVKTNKDQEERWEAMKAALEGLLEPIRGTSKIVKPPKNASEDLMCVLPMGDPHVGMFAWMEETGQDFDLKIAEDNLRSAVDHLVAVSPKTALALLINLGDFFHTDNSSNQTPQSGHALDVDTRYFKMCQVGLRIMVYLIEKLLTKHDKVRVICVPGNHDPHSSQWMALALWAFFHNNPRVEIDMGPGAFFWFRFGENLIGATHGDNCKLERLPGVMSVDRKEDWGQTSHRYWYTGHVHHDKLKELDGCIVETFRTLAPKDAWHTKKGYRSEQDMKCDIVHIKHGRINRHIVGIRQLWDK